MQPAKHNKLFDKIKVLIEQARSQVAQAINHTMVSSYYEIGQYIVEDEQSGKERAVYSKATLKNLSEQLTNEFGRGFSLQNLRNMRHFYLVYSMIQLRQFEFHGIFVAVLF